MRLIRLTGIILLLVFWEGTRAQDVKAVARLDTGAILIGDHVGLKLQLSGPSETQVIWPAFGDTILGNILVIGRSKIDSSFSADRKSLTLTQELNLTSFDSGFYTIPQIPFRYRVRPDTSLRTAMTGLTMLMVHTVKVDTTVAIKPIKAPLSVPLTFRELLPYIMMGLALIVLVVLVIWYLKKRKKNEPLIQVRPKIQLLPHEKALQELEKLRVRKLWQQGQVKEYYSELTDIIRTYIEEGFGMPAMESTTYEIVVQLRSGGRFAGAVIGKLEAMLSLADMVKFAKADPLPADNENALNTGFEFVRDTKGAAPSVPSAEPQGQTHPQS